MIVIIEALHFVKQNRTFTDFKEINTAQSHSFLILLEQMKVKTKDSLFDNNTPCINKASQKTNFDIK